MSAGERFEVRVETRFYPAAAGSDAGARAEPAVERWNVAVRASSASLDSIALVVDFRRLLADTDEELATLRAEVADQPDRSLPTAPELAVLLLRRLRGRYCDEPFRIESVEVSPDPAISYVAGSPLAD